MARRKVRGLLECGAKVKLISPEVTPGLEKLVKSGKIAYLRRAYRKGDLKGAFLAIGATDEPAVNERIFAEATEAGILVNIVDRPALCSFTLPARVRRGPVMVAVSTGGASPALARRLREMLEETIGPEYGRLAQLLGKLRAEVKRSFPTEAGRRRAWQRILDCPEVLALLRAGKLSEAEAKARRCLSSPSA